ncbi:class I SAM-dependent methyltransferase [Mesorhizobium sp. SB112]|uniref:class I SAM-dependent methyltransferase n=1 Tax=Mesorhizobium sp. SB112 TaxID=3151853 RepID=UPI0032675167
MTTSYIDKFSSCLVERAPIFSQELARTRLAEPDTFNRLAEPMLKWAEIALGETWAEQLVDGYCEFVLDVNRSQLKYEKSGRYENSSFAEVFSKAYSDPEFMQLYHWGVYTTTFVWTHHLRIYKLFESQFVPLLKNVSGGSLVDLGAGSGIWHLLSLQNVPSLSVSAVDVSEPTIERSKNMAKTLGYGDKITHHVADALTWKPDAPAQAGISCFLLEHLEQPNALLAGLANSIEPGAPAFVTSALTAAEIDHIFEYRRESELVIACEQAGFRVLSMYSATPDTTPRSRYFAPRSIGLVLQKRTNAIW